MHIERWIKADRFTAGRSDVVDMRDNVAERHSVSSLDFLCRRALGFGRPALRRLVLAMHDRWGVYLSGREIELGAGAGFFGVAVLEENPPVEELLSLEISESHVEQVMLRVAADSLGGNLSKFQPVIGSFDDIRLEDSNLDFAVQINSLHHSNDLDLTLKEVVRVLKPGGLLICLDRSHPDFVTDQDIEAMLNLEYDDEALQKIGFPPGTKYTRADNGEHEYRDRDWKNYAQRSGLTVEIFERIGGHFSIKKLMRGLLVRCPRFVGKALSSISPVLKKTLVNRHYSPRAGELAYQFGLLFKKNYKFEREITFMVFKKPGSESLSKLVD